MMNATIEQAQLSKKEFLTTAELANYLGVSISRVAHLTLRHNMPVAKRGTSGANKKGRFYRLEEVNAWINKNPDVYGNVYKKHDRPAAVKTTTISRTSYGKRGLDDLDGRTLTFKRIMHGGFGYLLGFDPNGKCYVIAERMPQ